MTGDLEFLRERVVPGLKEIALFLKIMPVIEMRMEKQFFIRVFLLKMRHWILIPEKGHIRRQSTR